MGDLVPECAPTARARGKLKRAFGYLLRMLFTNGQSQVVLCTAVCTLRRRVHTVRNNNFHTNSHHTPHTTIPPHTTTTPPPPRHHHPIPLPRLLPRPTHPTLPPPLPGKLSVGHRGATSSFVAAARTGDGHSERRKWRTTARRRVARLATSPELHTDKRLLLGRV